MGRLNLPTSHLYIPSHYFDMFLFIVFSPYRQLDPTLIPLFEELCREQVEALIQPEEVKQKKKQRKIETEVAELKIKLATTQARAMVLSNREIRLLRCVSECSHYVL